MRFIDSTGLNALDAVRRKTGRTIALTRLQAPCRRVFETTSLDKVFLIEE